MMHTTRQPNLRSLTITRFIARHWLVIFLLIYGLANALPFAAPVFMKLGWTGAGDAVYTFYSALCHQMAQRSFFLFGEQAMYRPEQLPLALTGHGGTDMMLLRHFQGNDVLGWKVAWSDRMISLYSGAWLVGLVYWGVTRVRTIRPISGWTFALFLLPIALDGGTHMISDSLDSVVSGFRYDNAWLATLTGNTLPASFYNGDAWGSFNSIMRMVTGLVAATGVVWFVFPWLDRSARRTIYEIDLRRVRIAEKQRRRAAQLADAHEQIRNIHV